MRKTAMGILVAAAAAATAAYGDGFDPADKDSSAAWLSTVPVPDSVSRVCDYFAVMTQP